MAQPFSFDHAQAFDAGADPLEAEAILRSIPAEPGVFALFGPGEASDLRGDSRPQPYLTRAADLRRRIRRLLQPPAEPVAGAEVSALSKRLNLRHKVARIEYTVTGSEFASSLVLYHAAVALFGYTEARRRLKLHTPFFLRYAAENDFPRLYVTNRLTRRSLAYTYGPFPSRAAAERSCDAILDLFKLRRCYEELEPSPEHPGCVYQEMKKCLAPCNQALTAEARAVYSAEADEVARFLATHGESLLTQIAAARDEASASMDFEAAAALHAQHQKVKAAAGMADVIVQPVPQLRAVIVQTAAVLPRLRGGVAASSPTEGEAADSSPSAATHADVAAVFLLAAGCLIGPEPLSTLGVRAVKEQTSVGSSLFAQPLMLQAVPLAADDGAPAEAKADVALNPESRAAQLLRHMEDEHSSAPPTDLALLSDHLSLLRRWYYRPEKQRTGEIFFANADGGWPVRRILRGAARMALGEPAAMAETQREAAKAIKAAGKTKILHEGRPDVERVVPVATKPSETDAYEGGDQALPGFRSRRKK